MQLLNASLPKGATNIHYRRRIAGGGSLGRPRYVAIADWRGGRVMREAKALVPSAWTYVHGAQPPGFLKLARGRYRAPDPFLDVQGKWIIRRLAPDFPQDRTQRGRHDASEETTCCRRWPSTLPRFTPRVRSASTCCGAT